MFIVVEVLAEPQFSEVAAADLLADPEVGAHHQHGAGGGGPGPGRSHVRSVAAARLAHSEI